MTASSPSTTLNAFHGSAFDAVVTDVFLTKPLNAATLCATVERLLAVKP